MYILNIECIYPTKMSMWKEGKMPFKYFLNFYHHYHHHHHHHYYHAPCNTVKTPSGATTRFSPWLLFILHGECFNWWAAHKPKEAAGGLQHSEGKGLGNLSTWVPYPRGLSVWGKEPGTSAVEHSIRPLMAVISCLCSQGLWFWHRLAASL